MRTKAFLLAATVLLGGCYSFRGPEPVLQKAGVVLRDSEGPREGEFFQRFRLAAQRASGCQLIPPQPAPAGLQCAAVPSDQHDALMRDYMRAGFLLALIECDHYFAHMGRNQGRSRILRDAIAPIAALITGFVALRGNTAGGIPELTLATAATTSTLDIFDQRFLFGSDNITAVRRLVFRALDAHSTAALAATSLNFEQASGQILAYQHICTPPEILTLTRQSIQNAVPAADPPAAGSRPQPGTPPAGQGMSTTTVSVPEPR